ncbi:MAG: CoA transferase [Chloroflexi bacterium]|nr:CoA transferase [Chloroflexota bacterium]
MPLAGVRVVDMTLVWAGPSATMFLADWGADVLKVESTQHFQTASRGNVARPSREEVIALRSWRHAYPNDEPGERPWNRFSLFQNHSRNKRSFTVDLRRPEGMEVLESVLRVSDVLIENNVPETAEGLGITYEWARSIKPDIVMVQMPAYGLEGEYKNYRSYGSHVEAVSGHTYIRGYPDLDMSSKDEVLFADASGGLVAAFAAVSALHRRRSTGEGAHVELSLVENMIPNLGEAIMDYTMNRRVQDTLGNRDPYRTPQGCYPCRGDDRWITISVGDEAEWRRFARAIGRADLLDDPRFRTILARRRNHDALDEIVAGWTARRDPNEAMERLQRAGVTAGAVISDADAYGDPHLEARRFFQTITQADIGTYPYPGIMWRASATPNSIRQPPIRLGEHNGYIYRELLGVTGETYDRLEREGHIGEDYAAHIK